MEIRNPDCGIEIRSQFTCFTEAGVKSNDFPHYVDSNVRAGTQGEHVKCSCI